MISLSSLKALLDIDAAETQYDDLLVEMEDEAVAYIERETGHYFREKADTSVSLIGDGGRRLWLPDLPSDGPAAVSGAAHPGATVTELAVDTDYVVRTSGNEAWLERANGAYWTNGHTFSLTYERGYDAGMEPAEIRGAVRELVRLRFRSRGFAGVGALRSESVGGYSYSLTDGGEESAPPSVRDVIRQWRRPVIA